MKKWSDGVEDSIRVTASLSRLSVSPVTRTRSDPNEDTTYQVVRSAGKLERLEIPSEKLTLLGCSQSVVPNSQQNHAISASPSSTALGQARCPPSHDEGLFVCLLLASQSDALKVAPYRDFPSIQPSTYRSEACMPCYIMDRKSFKNSDNAMK